MSDFLFGASGGGSSSPSTLTSPVTTDPLTFSGALTFSKQVVVNNASSPSSVVGTASGQKVLIVKGAASQSVNIFESQDSSANPLIAHTAAGALAFGTAGDVSIVRTAADQLKVTGPGAYDVFLGKVSGKQGINLGGDTLISRTGAGSVQVDGNVAIGGAGWYFQPGVSAGQNEQTTVGAAGAASAPPATPTGYFKFKNGAGTVVVVPYYAAS